MHAPGNSSLTPASATFSEGIIMASIGGGCPTFTPPKSRVKPSGRDLFLARHNCASSATASEMNAGFLGFSAPARSMRNGFALFMLPPLRFPAFEKQTRESSRATQHPFQRPDHAVGFGHRSNHSAAHRRLDSLVCFSNAGNRKGGN